MSDNKKQKTVLVTAIGSFAADITIKNLRRAGFRVVGCDINEREVLVDAGNVDVFYQVPLVNAPNFSEVIRIICRNERITHLIPLTDVEVDYYSEHRAEYEKMGVVVCISPESTIDICRNKYVQYRFIRENVPEIDTIPTVEYYKGMEIPFDYPFVCKPYNGRSSIGLRYINSPADWSAFEAAGAEGSIVQPMIRGRIITTDVVRMKNGERIVAIPRVELLRTGNGAGTSVKVISDPIIEDKCKLLAERFGVVGCVNYEFIKTEDEEYYYLECNPRFSGGIEFSCIAGYDCIGNSVRAFESEEIDEFVLEAELYIARKYEEYVTRVEPLHGDAK